MPHALAAESLDKDEVPQDLIDMTARAADDTGRMVRSHPTSGLTPDKKRQRTAMADLAERFEREKVTNGTRGMKTLMPRLLNV